MGGPTRQWDDREDLTREAAITATPDRPDPAPGGLEVVAETELVLVRHGQAERGLTGPHRGDPWLSARGRAEAACLAEELAEEKFDAIYSSPLRRAVQTVEPIFTACGLEPRFREGLAEFDRHSGEYLFFEDLKKANDPRYRACLKGDLTAWGTDFPTFRDEAVAVLREITDAHAGERILIATHGGTLNVLLGSVLGLAGMWFYFPDNGSISRVVVGAKNRMRIVTLNERHHLRGVDHAEPLRVDG